MEQQESKKNKKPWSKKKKVTVIIIAALLLLLCVGGVSCVASIVNMSKSMMTAMTDYGTAEKGDIEVVTESFGVAEAVNTQNLMIDYTCDLLTLYRQNGEEVQAGDVIASFAPIVSDTNIENLEQSLTNLDTQLAYANRKGSSSITAPAAGRVKAIYGEAGQEVTQVMQEHGALMLLSGDEKLQVRLERENPDWEVSIGDPASVIFNGTTVEGKVEAVQGKTVIVTFPDSADYEIDVEAEIAVKDSVIGSGRISCHLPITVIGTNGTIDSIPVEKNNKVSSGSTLVKLKNVEYSDDYMALVNQREELVAQITKAKQYMSGYTLVASQAGIISELTALEGDTVPAGTRLCSILGNDSFQVKVEIDELDIRGIAVGQEAVVTFDAIENQEYFGKVSNVSLAGDNQGGVATYTITILLDDTKEILPGLSANAKITTGLQKDVMLIPVECIQTIDGKKCVIRFNEDGSMETIPVTLGLVNNTFAEVSGDIREGDLLQKVVTMEDIYSQMGISLVEPAEE